MFKPMLAATVENTAALRWPVLASPKIDGIRCVIRDGVAYSRSNKPIRNRYVQEAVSNHAEILNGLDGELVVGRPTDNDVYRNTNSAVMRYTGEPEFTFYAFDCIDDITQPFSYRLKSVLSRDLPAFVKVVEHTKVESQDQLLELEAAALALGYEGLMLRDPLSPYKFGRSTLSESYLMKLKRFTDAEALCIGYGELMHNGNVAEINELGHTQRSSCKDGLTPGNMLGYLLVRNTDWVEFKIGTGFTQEERISLWAEREDLIGKLVKYKFFNVGIKEAPRHPVWLGFRDLDDLDHRFDTTGVQVENPAVNSWKRALGLTTEV